jgi:RNA polymerase sigma factor (sigma-70 family)
MDKKEIDLESIKLGKSQAIRALYENSFSSCARLIMNNSGSLEDAQDLFQEAIIVFIQKLKKPKFQLTASPSTFIYAIVRNLWLKQLRKNGKKALLIVDDEEKHLQIPAVEDIEEVYLKENKHLAIEDAIKSLSEECQSIIMHYYFNKLSLGRIAELLNYSKNFIKVKKKRCMDGLKAKVLTKEQKS